MSGEVEFDECDFCHIEKPVENLSKTNQIC